MESREEYADLEMADIPEETNKQTRKYGAEVLKSEQNNRNSLGKGPDPEECSTEPHNRTNSWKYSSRGHPALNRQRRNPLKI